MSQCQTSDYIWVKIDKNILQLDKDILLCACYIPPSHSSYFNPDTLPNLENEINLFKKDYFVVLVGDFNARTGVQHDFINYDNCNFAPGGISPPPKITPRKSFDTHVNDLGKQLLEMCKSLDLRILNGRCKGDSLGQSTFHGNQCSSTVDYIIASHEILYLFETLVVRQPSPFSDHCQLITWINIDSSLLTNDEESFENELLSLPKQFKWSADSKDSFTFALNSDETKQLIEDFELLNFEHVGDINIIVEKFAHILETVAKQSLKIVKQNKKLKRNYQLWFDNECSRARKNLNRLSHRTHKNPLDQQTRLQYLLTRSQYKHLLRTKKLQHRDNKIDELIKTRHPLKFWTTLKSLSNQVESSLDSTVPMRKLYNHFQKLHSEPSANLLKKQEEIMKELEHKKTTLSQLNILDKPFSEEEVKQSIKRLKNKKAAGLDRIRNEMLKSGAQYLTTSLTKLFNFILNKGSYPDSWSTGLISPIFKSGNKSDPSNYRGICVTSCLGK